MLAMDTEREKYTAASRKTATALSADSQKASQKASQYCARYDDVSGQRCRDHGPRTAGTNLKRVITYVVASRIASIK
jgi:hypothetical protein